MCSVDADVQMTYKEVIIITIPRVIYLFPLTFCSALLIFPTWQPCALSRCVVELKSLANMYVRVKHSLLRYSTQIKVRFSFSFTQSFVLFAATKSARKPCELRFAWFSWKCNNFDEMKWQWVWLIIVIISLSKIILMNSLIIILLSYREADINIWGSLWRHLVSETICDQLTIKLTDIM